MKMKRGKTRFYCYFCSSHILITFVGMTLLIVNYGVNTVQMSEVPPESKGANSTSSTRSNSTSSLRGSNGLSSSINEYNLDNKERGKSVLGRILAKRKSKKYSENTNNLQEIPLPTTTAVYNEEYAAMEKMPHLLMGNFRKPRFFGLFASNYSLSYNLTLSTGTSAGNIAVVAPSPTPTYYYYPAPSPTYYYYPVPAPSYPPYDPNSYYYYYDPNIYASNPYYYYNPSDPYNQNPGYIYYG